MCSFPAYPLCSNKALCKKQKKSGCMKFYVLEFKVTCIQMSQSSDNSLLRSLEFLLNCLFKKFTPTEFI